MDKQDNDLLILDLDNTLISAVNKAYLTNVPNYPSDFRAMDGMYHVNMRPNLHIFLEYAFNNWRVAIWTVAHLDYAEEILIKCGIDINKFEFIKVNEDCTEGSGEGFRKIHIKDMTKLDEDLSRVILVDDKKSSSLNLPDNVIEIYPYISASQKDDDKLLKLIDLLSEMKKSSDFRTFDKTNWSI